MSEAERWHFIENLFQVSLSDKRSLHLDPERQRLIQQQVMLDYRRQPSQVWRESQINLLDLKSPFTECGGDTCSE